MQRYSQTFNGKHVRYVKVVKDLGNGRALVAYWSAAGYSTTAPYDIAWENLKQA